MQKIKSVRTKLFITLTFTLIVIIVSLIVLNSVVLGSFYLYSKRQDLLKVYYAVNNYYNSENHNIDLELELEKISIKNNFDIFFAIIFNSDIGFVNFLEITETIIPLIMIVKIPIIHKN